MIRNYFNKLLAKYLSIYIRPQNTVVEVEPFHNLLQNSILASKYVTVENESLVAEQLSVVKPDYIILNGLIHYKPDIQRFLETIQQNTPSSTRIIVCYYSALWRPFVKLATFLRMRNRKPEENWVSPHDVNNFAQLAGFEIVAQQSRILMPIYIPIIGWFFNKILSPIPFFKLFNLVNIAVLRPLKNPFSAQPSVSIVVPARNEAGNIENIIKRLPKMGANDEIIYIEGNSTDNTWEVVQDVYNRYRTTHNIQIGQQDGKGKANAVWKGFDMARNEILMILDADITVPPEDLPKFYKAIVSGKAEFINGSRLVYPMEKKAMRFFNILGNKFFANAFSYVLNQPLKDTLCGTKVLTKENYQKIVDNRSFFGDFDPFGDFDLLFGSSRLGLKIIEVPITYRARTYGDTNIQRWKHGVILLRMLLFAMRKLKFV